MAWLDRDLFLIFSNKYFYRKSMRDLQACLCIKIRQNPKESSRPCTYIKIGIKILNIHILIKFIDGLNHNFVV